MKIEKAGTDRLRHRKSMHEAPRQPHKTAKAFALKKKDNNIVLKIIRHRLKKAKKKNIVIVAKVFTGALQIRKVKQKNKYINDKEKQACFISGTAKITIMVSYIRVNSRFIFFYYVIKYSYMTVASAEIQQFNIISNIR